MEWSLGVEFGVAFWSGHLEWNEVRFWTSLYKVNVLCKAM